MKKEDKTRMDKSLVVKVDAQLFYSLLTAMPYIKNYPYKNSITLSNTMVATSIVDSLYKQFPSVGEMAKKLSKRKSQFEKWNEKDPNRQMNLIESPWLEISRGGDDRNLANTLDPKINKGTFDLNQRELLSSQTSIGGFPWFKGGRPSLYTTIYVLNSYAKMSEFDGKLPKRELQRAWSYVEKEYRSMISWCMAHKACYETITFINFTLSTYKDKSIYERYFPENLRKEMLDFSFKYWKLHSPQLKGMLALTLSRYKRSDDAKLVFDSVLDSVKTEEELGSFWAPEDKSWLWYNDTIETHAYALRTNIELNPKSKLNSGLVQWLYLNKKLNHWKSTRATAEVLYSVAHYLKAENQLSKKEIINIDFGTTKKEFVFDPKEYTGKDNFVVLKGEEIKKQKVDKINFEQKTDGMSFGSAVWHYSTEVLPDSAKGDLLQVKREFFLRKTIKGEHTLTPLKDGAKIVIGDQIEVHLVIKAKHEAEYVHLRDPRPSGVEPETKISTYKWDLGVIRFEEVRDSGVNFFIEKLPVGEYTLKHRMRVNMGGVFRTHPAKLQSLYAPEFNAFSSGEVLSIE